MALLTLPRELRQKILLHALDQQDSFTGGIWPAWTTGLLLVCKTIYHDMPWVISSWNPTWCLTRPEDMGSLRPVIINGTECWPKLTSLYFILFCNTDLKMLGRIDELIHPILLYQDLMQAWYDGITQLPHLPLETALLDVTVAPGWIREPAIEGTCKHDVPTWMHKEAKWHFGRLLRDARVGREFLSAHVDGIARLVRQISDRYEHGVGISLVGKVGRGSSGFKTKVMHRCTAGGTPIEYHVEFVDDNSRTIQHFVRDLAPKNKPPGISPEAWQRALRLAPLRRVAWSRRTIGVFERVASGSSWAAMWEDVRAMAEAMVAEVAVRLDTAPAGTVHRAMIHGMARDMGLCTVSEGEGEDRHVIVSNQRNEVARYGVVPKEREWELLVSRSVT